MKRRICSQLFDIFRRKRRAQGILENDVNSKLESSANGITNFGLVVSLATIILSVPVILFYRQVQLIGINIWQDPDKLPDCQKPRVQ